ncbi:MAG: hypothetical protein WBA06_08865 [Candidatus Aquilonibacter sp.]|jgi:hypothetical protein
MYFTIDEREPSSAIQDARRSFNTIRSQAAALAGLSASFQEQASEVTSSYRRALADGTESSWARFIYAASDIAQHGQAVEELLGLRAPERAAWRAFRQIADENADLLLRQPAMATA